MTSDIFDRVAKNRARIERAARRLARLGRKLYQFQRKGGGSIAVHAATRKPGTWQITRFDDSGEPTGHTEAATCLDALIEAARWQGAILWARRK